MDQWVSFRLRRRWGSRSGTGGGAAGERSGLGFLLRWSRRSLAAALASLLLWALFPAGASADLAEGSESRVPAVPILMYHAISYGPNTLYVPPPELESHLSYLAGQGYHAITLQQLYDNFRYGEPLPAKPVVLTFDDGYVDFYTNALPLFRKYGMVATLFVIVDRVDHPGYITWEQAKEIAAAGMEIGSHTMSHPDLRPLSPTRLQYELADSRAILAQRLRVPVRFFAYPAGHFNEQTLRQMRLIYDGAVTTVGGVATPCQEFQQWRRVRVMPGWSGERLVNVMGYWERETKVPECSPGPVRRRLRPVPGIGPLP